MPIISNFPSRSTDGREVELQSNGVYIQWRYVGDTSWTNLVSLAELTGDQGVGITSVTQVTTSTADEGENVVRVTLSNGVTQDFVVRNGSQGSAGPNEVSGSTATALSGILKGNGSNVAVAEEGTDYAAAKIGVVSVTASTTLGLSHAEKTVRVSSSSAVTITVPTNTSVAFPVGTCIVVTGVGTGTVTITPASGVTLNSKDGGGAARTIDGQYAAVSLYKSGTNVWEIWGALA